MNWLDYAIIAILAVSGLVGLARGFVRELVSLGVWIAALLVAWFFHREVADMLVAQISHPGVRLGVSFAGLVVLVLFLGAIIGAILAALVDKAGLSVFDRLLGFFFGVARGGVVVAMSVYLIALSPVRDEPWWGEAQLVGQFQSLADSILALVPASVQARLGKI